MRYCFLVVLALFSVVLTSCMRTYQRCYQHAFAMDGVYCENKAVYESNGKKYVKGQRAQLRNVRYRSWENFYECYWGRGWRMMPIPGTEGETVYCELAADDDGKYDFKKGCEWQVQNGKKFTLCKDKETEYLCTTTECGTRRLTWRGVYALPAAVACFTVEAPFNVVSSVLHVVFGWY